MEISLPLENRVEGTELRSKRLTRTNPILRLNNRVCHDFNREHCGKNQQAGERSRRNGEDRLTEHDTARTPVNYTHTRITEKPTLKETCMMRNNLSFHQKEAIAVQSRFPLQEGVGM